MRIFTAIMAFALLFSACSKEESTLVSAADPVLTRGNGDLVGFNKVKLIDGEQIPAEDGEFRFELYQANKNSGNYQKIRDFSTLNGGVWINFTELSPGKKYLFREITREGWEPIADLPFTVVARSGAVWDGVSYRYGTGPTVVNIPLAPERVLGEELGDGITLTNDARSPFQLKKENGKGYQHFCYAVLNVADLAEGVTLDLVKGAKIDDVGDAFVRLADGRITVTIDGEARFRAKVYTEVPVFKNNGKELDDNLDCPDAEVIYLYVFFDSVRFWIYQ